MRYLLVCFLSITNLLLKAQTKLDTIQATEFSIPQSGAFTLLGNTPSAVNTPGFTKDIQLDYFFNEFSLRPNLAFECQPFWLFGFKNKSLVDYQKTSPVLRFLSTSSVSLGTIQVNDDVNKFAYSIRFSFWHDPMMDTSYINGMDKLLSESRIEREGTDIQITVKRRRLKNEIKRLETSLDTTTDSGKRDALRDSIAMKEANLVAMYIQLTELDSTINISLEKKVRNYAKDYIESNWYKPKLDIGIGKVDTYTDPSVPSIDLKKNGIGIWLNGSIGFIPRSKNVNKAKNNKVLLTGIYKHIEVEKEKEEFYGGNIRYGSSAINLFIEYTFSRESSVKTQTIAYGGSYKIGSKKIIEFGLRTNYNEDFKFKNLKPVISINWEFGKDLLK